MKIGILGSGMVGQVLAAGFIKHGHQAMIGTRNPQKLADWSERNPEVKIGSAAGGGDLRRSDRAVHERQRAPRRCWRSPARRISPARW
jgi:predicted dinucleotide-binding enzyme